MAFRLNFCKLHIVKKQKNYSVLKVNAKNMIKWAASVCLNLGIVVASMAQDPLFSQYYAAPMYLNPAFTGSSFNPRFTLNYRNQWPGLSANFVTTSFTAETFVDKWNSGVGIQITGDNQFQDLSTTTIGGMYSYNVVFTDKLSARFGLAASYNSRGINNTWDRFTFGDQLDANGNPNNSPTFDPVAGNNKPRFNFVDFTTGTVFYNDQFWAGVSVKHLNMPQYNFLKDNSTPDRLPMMFSVHGGYKFYMANGYMDMGLANEVDREKSIAPSFVYERRGAYQHLDMGLYLTYAPLVLGAWYRGLPLFQEDESGKARQVAGIGMVGFRQDNITIGYSYDFNLLDKLSSSGGAHEISISYQLNIEKGYKSYRKKKVKPIPCPKL
jgi:type IX secretion system PorP/SprF family membrane protein